MHLLYNNKGKLTPVCQSPFVLGIHRNLTISNTVTTTNQIRKIAINTINTTI